jgi:hypothetical protein
MQEIHSYSSNHPLLTEIPNFSCVFGTGKPTAGAMELPSSSRPQMRVGGQSSKQRGLIRKFRN